MPPSSPPVLYLIDRAPRFRRQLVEAIRHDGGEAYGVESVRRALHLLELFPRQFRVLFDLGPRASQALGRLRAHPQVLEVTVLSPGRLERRRRRATPGRRSRARVRQREVPEPDGPCSLEGTVVHGATAKQTAITRYPTAHGQAGCSQSTVSLDVQR